MVVKQLIFFITVSTILTELHAQQGVAEEILGSDCMEAGSASIVVFDLDRDEEIYSFDAERALPTASIQKMLTTAAILKKRGSDFQYETEFGYRGVIREEVLEGDLVVKGSGDPTMGSGYFEEGWDVKKISEKLLVQLSEVGVRKITGDIVLDVSAAPGQHVPGGWPWSDLGNYYGAGHWSLNIHDNEYKIFFRQNNSYGQITSILRTVPELYPFTLTNEVRTGPAGSGDRAYIYAAPYAKGATIRGTIPPGNGSFSIRGSLTNPPMFFGRQLAVRLAQSSVDYRGQVKKSITSVDGTHTLFTVLSPTLLDVARITNHRSVNLYAEALLKLLCETPETVSQFECGLETLKSFWQDYGLDEDQFFFKDGSGLSPRNVASALSFTHALKAIYHDKPFYKIFLSSLPEMGKQGTLRYMLRGYDGSGRIHAKSGYIGRQRSYAGYMTTESGRTMAFCIILDNYSCSSTRIRQRIERFLISFLRNHN